MDWFVVSVSTSTPQEVREEFEKYADRLLDVKVNEPVVAVRVDIEPSLGSGGPSWKSDGERILEEILELGSKGSVVYVNDTTNSSEAHVYKLGGGTLKHVDEFEAGETRNWETDAAEKVEDNYGFFPKVR